jgi:AraC-like DNA-binding protein
MADQVPVPARFARFRFSTDDYPARDRIGAWREVFGRTVLRLNFEAPRQQTFRAVGTGFKSAGLGVMFATTSAVRQATARDLISSDDISFIIAASPAWRTTLSSRACSPGRGDGVLLPHDDLGSITFAETSSYVAFCVPREVIRARIADFDAAVMRPIPASALAMRLLSGYLDVVRNLPLTADARAQRVIETHVHDLLALAVGAKRDDAEFARQRGLRAAQLHAIKAAVVKNLRQTLSIDAVASAYQISPRQVQRLFELDGTTFTEFVLHERLALAHRLLCASDQAARSIGALALEAGFGDLSYFNRSFRRRYGATPSDVRAGVQGNEA